MRRVSAEVPFVAIAAMSWIGEPTRLGTLLLVIFIAILLPLLIHLR